MLPSALDLVDVSDLESLINEQVQEGKRVDFKRQFYDLDAKDEKYREKQRIEILKDISSFANTMGGDLIIGMDEHQASASDLCGFECDDIDKLKNRVNQFVESWLQPKVSMAMKSIKHNGRDVLIIRIQQSLIAPHRVTYNKNNQFWARNDTGSYLMDTTDLRRAFALSSTVFQQIDQFRRSRVAKHANVPTLIAHVVPQDSFATAIDLKPAELKKPLPLLGTSYSYPSVNFDGVLLTNTMDTPDASQELQRFRNGAIEIACRDMVFTERNPVHRMIQDSRFFHLIKSLPFYLGETKEKGFRPPIWVLVTLTNVRGLFLPNHSHTPSAAIDRDNLWLPEVEINDISSNIEQAMKPAFDMIWNACGFEFCPHYTADGNFSHRKFD